MNSEEDEFKRIEREAKRRAARLKEIMYWMAMDDDDTQVYTSDVALAEAYRCGFEAGAVAEREACAKVCGDFAGALDAATAIRARGTT